ncbi:hypothetical protein [Roseimicrobium sp. ORNL1]|uniref:hypothetical protein n=1 Tax=Roseimicrobium sp. ORNL1 TaxID=2711231 RepID=UPI0013E19187|nr:hypothetical protein [Roseimicrobium sp. ORNL1]QIF05281.1 hypothetical protein G5S37_28490 [Roseimicrobium sp. ORNL1]
MLPERSTSPEQFPIGGNKVESVQDRLTRQERRLDRLALHCQAMWEMLRERAEFTEEEISAKILEVDLRDGRADGRISQQVATCPSCKQRTSTKRETCVICGAELGRNLAFEV